MGRRGTFRRRDAQLSSMDLLSQLQSFLMGHVLLLPRMALVPQEKVGRPHQNRAQNLGGSSSTPETREVALPSLSEFEFCCHLCMPEHHEYSRPSTLSTLLTLPSLNSLPASLQPLLSSCAPLSPHAPLSLHALLSPHPPPAPSLPWQPIAPCQHLPVPISQGSPFSPLTISSSMPGPSHQSQQETHRHSQEVGVPFFHYTLPCPPSLYLL